MGMRQDRLADEVRDIIASCFLGGVLNDPRLESVTITAVKLSGDLQVASVYFRVYNDADVKAAVAGLESVAGFLRNKLAKTLDIRRVPTLRFFYDESIEKASTIEKLLSQI